ncbi:MAG: hypothetical protein AAB372_01055 [Patescibacteria group bacterium]
MASSIDYGLFAFVVGCIVEGIVVYMVDYHYGRTAYRVWYDFTHGEKLGDNINLGFVHGQRFSSRFTVALMIVLAQSALGFWVGAASILRLIFSIPFEGIFMIVGFYAGPWFARLWSRKQPLLDAVDRIESGEIDIRERAGAFLARWRRARRVSEKAAVSVPVPPSDVVVSAPADPVPSPTELVGRFVRHGSEEPTVTAVKGEPNDGDKRF